jgi:hypothetical protein
MAEIRPNFEIFTNNAQNAPVQNLGAIVKFPIREASVDFNIEYNLVQKWWAMRTKLFDSDAIGSIRKIGPGRKRKHPDIEEALVAWVADKRAVSLPVSNANMASEAMRRFPDAFTYCLKWTYNILERNELSIRRKTHDQVVMEEDEMGSIHLDFVIHFTRLREFHAIPWNLCVNMDETGCYFDMGSSTTIHKKGSKHVNVKSTSNSNHCTVFLSVALDGSKLKPLVVFKGAANGSVSKKLNSLDQRNAYICQEKAYCDASVMSIWISECLAPHHVEKRPALLMMDNFKAHLVKPVRDLLAKNCWLQLNLPANMTSRVQILDVGVNKPFKGRMRAYYNQYMLDCHPEYGKVTRELMASWIANAWETMPASAIINTARKIGFIQ